MNRSIKIIANILLAFAGPVATTFLVLAGKGFKIQTGMFLFVGLATVIAVIVSIAVRSLYKTTDRPKATFKAVIFIELGCALLLVIDALIHPKSMMWLPVALLFLPLFTLPTAISVAWGTGRIMEIMREKN